MSKINTDAIKASVDIADVVSRYIDLKKDGHEYKACCPFHDEKTPSFTVAPDKQFYHCFGCGAHGDVIDFVTEYTGCDFKEAAETLGHKKLNCEAPVKKRAQRVDPYAAYTPITDGRDESQFLVERCQYTLTNPKRDGKQWVCHPEAVYRYSHNAAVIRLSIDGKKLTPMVRWCNGPQGEGWHMYPFDEPRPIYGDLIPSKQVLVVEGEKTRDAVAKLVGDRISVVSWSGGTNGIEKTDWSPLQAQRVILWPDNDEPGFKAMRWLKNHLQDGTRCVIPDDPELPKGWDAADREWASADELFQYCKDHLGELPADDAQPVPASLPPAAPPPDEPPPPTPSDWREQLMFKDNGNLVSNINNAQAMMSYHDDLQGVIGFNEFTKSIDICKRPPWETEPSHYPRVLTDVDDTRACAWLERHGINLGIATTHNIIVSAGHHTKYNPLQDYLNSLEWDGTERLTTALHRFFGCEDNEYSRAVSRRFLIGSVARALNPGCKMDTMLILEGPQGLKKSTVVAELYGEDWFTDELGDLGSKDAGMQVQGVWCVEIAELATMNRAEANRTKEWITRRVDRFRPPYGRNLLRAPRQCVLVGTVNPEGGYLKDATGGRRFWPIKCTNIDIKAVKKERDQVWAEAVSAFKSGERWWFEHEERHIAIAEQEERYESDAWDDPVRKYIKGMDKTSVSEIMEQCLDLKSRDQNQLAMTRIAKILVSCGWSRKRRRIEGRLQWVYIKETEWDLGTSVGSLETK